MPTSRADRRVLRILAALIVAGCVLLAVGVLLDRYTGPAGDAPAGLAMH